MTGTIDNDTALDAIRIREIWLSVLEANIVKHRPTGSNMVEDHAATPLGTLCIIGYNFRLWPIEEPPSTLEFPPAALCRHIGLRTHETEQGEGFGLDIDWINAMTDRGCDDRTIGRVVDDVLRNRREREGIA